MNIPVHFTEEIVKSILRTVGTRTLLITIQNVFAHGDGFDIADESMSDDGLVQFHTLLDSLKLVLALEDD